jgi:subtilisin family serine protease
MVRWIVLRAPCPIESGDVGRMAPDMAAETTLVVESIPVSAIADLECDPQTIAAAPEMPTSLIEPFATPEIAGGDAWGLTAVGAHASSHDGRGARVAVLDTGIDANHPAFLGIALTQRDFTGMGDGDRHGHGTHCAGTIVGRDVGQRIGVARGVTTLIVGKVLDDHGRGSTMGALFGLQWAAASGAHVVSMSLGFDTLGLVERLIADGWPEKLAVSVGLEAYRKNIRLFDAQLALFQAQRDFGFDPLVIAAAGNESRRQIETRFRIAASLPAAAAGVVSVGALGRTPAGLQVADFSNTLPTLAAPGVNIVSAWPGGDLKALNGTSMAGPHVAGVAALWWQALGTDANAQTVTERLIGSATHAGFAAGYDHTDVGRGIVQAP